MPKRLKIWPNCDRHQGHSLDHWIVVGCRPAGVHRTLQVVQDRKQLTRETCNAVTAFLSKLALGALPIVLKIGPRSLQQVEVFIPLLLGGATRFRNASASPRPSEAAWSSAISPAGFSPTAVPRVVGSVMVDSPLKPTAPRATQACGTVAWIHLAGSGTDVGESTLRRAASLVYVPMPTAVACRLSALMCSSATQAVSQPFPRRFDIGLHVALGPVLKHGDLVRGVALPGVE